MDCSGSRVSNISAEIVRLDDEREPKSKDIGRDFAMKLVRPSAILE